jgi:hypothetical protein
VVGRNCRFLQGPGTDPAVVDQLRQALSADPPRPVTVALLNYKRADDSGYQEPFWNSLHVAPLRDAGESGGEITGCLNRNTHDCVKDPRPVASRAEHASGQYKTQSLCSAKFETRMFVLKNCGCASCASIMQMVVFSFLWAFRWP